MVAERADDDPGDLRKGEGMNHENVLRVADVIEPLHYRGSRNIFSLQKPDAFCMAAGCGTACCVSGWTCEIFDVGGHSRSELEAQRILDLTDAQAHALFRPLGYPYKKCDGSAAARVLRKMEAAGDDVTEFQIWDFWKQL